MTKAFDMIMGGLDEVEAYVAGERQGFAVHIPDEVDVKAIRSGLNLSQPKFAATFGFSVGRVRDWEQKRFPVDAPSRVLLTVIEREPDAVLRALSQERGKAVGARSQAGKASVGKGAELAAAKASRPKSRSTPAKR
jgi:putative transcriptional regulator